MLIFDRKSAVSGSHKEENRISIGGRDIFEMASVMQDRAISFGQFRIMPRGGLMAGNREVRLTPKALALLSFLAKHPNEVVTKDELFAAVWPNTDVGDAALVTCIQELRKALRDNARRPRYIETLHRRGYRFIGKTSAGQPADDATQAAALQLPDRPSIAVLPFTNMSEDPTRSTLPTALRKT
jgi:DNA-binding winged helix-turn-helix (wHTH) protein